MKFNYPDYRTLPEGKRYELIEGELFPAPVPISFHQVFVFRKF